MFLSIVFVCLAAASASMSASAVTVSLPSPKPGVAPAFVDVRIAAATAAYAVQDNATDPNNTTAYVNVYDSHDYHVGRYPASAFFAAATAGNSNCGPATTAQIWNQSVPGYPLMDKYIKYRLRDVAPFYQSWATNEVGEQILFSCVGEGPFKVEAGVPAQCDEVEAETDAIVRGTTGRVKLEYKTGRQSALTLTTTKSSTMWIGVTVSVGIEIKVFSASVSTTIEQSVTNEESTSESTTLSTETTQSMELDASPNQRCSIKWNVQSCTAVGIARVPFVATGWLAVRACLVDYNTLCGGPIYYYRLDDNVPIDQRSSNMELKATTRTKSNGRSDSGCVNL
ncbi:hypothetical protein B0H19DRAFT_1065368 [Mycena capillaripes]|nr:hypothetical protein B0H19DRAFT_1065368 [Mycena capillaripes]